VSIEYAISSFGKTIIDPTPVKSESKEASEGGGTLLWALFRFFKGSLLLNAIPRLILITFRYSQPILINSTIRYVTGPVTEIEEQDVTGYNLIFAAFVIYVGSAVSCFFVYCSSLDTDGAIGILLHLLPKSQQNQSPVPWRARWAHSRSLSYNVRWHL
jgi:hypothetical protein